MSNIIDFNSKKKNKDDLNELVDALELRCQCGSNKYKLLILLEDKKIVIECIDCGCATDFNVLLSDMLKNMPDSIDDDCPF